MTIYHKSAGGYFNAHFHNPLIKHLKVSCTFKPNAISREKEKYIAIDRTTPTITLIKKKGKKNTHAVIFIIIIIEFIANINIIHNHTRYFFVIYITKDFTASITNLDIIMFCPIIRTIYITFISCM